ncbi:MAG TPA: hypothetical protein VF940_12060 [Streptosporangiaceae bacterium]
MSRDSGTWRRVTRAVTAATGTLIRKIARQLPASSSHPPRNGAIAAETPLNPAHVPIARVRSAGWKVASMIARLAGVISAPPMPCTARAAMSQPMPGAAAHSTDAAVNQPSPARNTRRRPQRSLSEPASRISEARVSV